MLCAQGIDLTPSCVDLRIECQARLSAAHFRRESNSSLGRIPSAHPHRSISSLCNTMKNSPSPSREQPTSGGALRNKCTYSKASCACSPSLSFSLYFGPCSTYPPTVCFAHHHVILGSRISKLESRTRHVALFFVPVPNLYVTGYLNACCRNPINVSSRLFCRPFYPWIRVMQAERIEKNMYILL